MTDSSPQKHTKREGGLNGVSYHNVEGNDGHENKKRAISSTHNGSNTNKVGADQLQLHTLTLSEEQTSRPWLDLNLDFVQAFSDKYGLELGKPSEPSTYYTLTEAGDKGLQMATNEMHQLFLKGTDYTLRHQHEVGKYFRIPEKLWPKIRESFETRRDDVISGRFDFAMTASNIKVYEYNADSASCLMECGHTQDKWAEAAGIGNLGRSNSDVLFPRLVETWREKGVTGLLHMMCDREGEEKYHTMYMMAAARAAGIQCKLLVGLDDISWRENEDTLQDEQGNAIANVWKTWSWRTALNELSEEETETFLEREQQHESHKLKRETTSRPKLAHVLFHHKIRVFEPLWTILPSCKAILPVLWKLEPDNPYLLKSTFELTKELVESGYVAKPVTGRAGSNVAMYNAGGSLLEATQGRWAEDQNVFQELCMLPRFGGEYVQVCTWAVGTTYAGTVLRVDKSGIIGYESGVYALRVVP